MKEYKMIEVEKKDAEEAMNYMAKDGWEVVSVACWNNVKICLLITFSKEK